MKTKIVNYGSGFVAGLFILAQNSFGATKYDQNLEKSFAATPGGKLVIDADRGSIEVTTDGEGKVHVRVFRQVKGGTQADADALFANHEVTLDQQGNTVSLLARNKKQPLWSSRNRSGLEVRYEVSLPKKFDVELKTSGGNIQAGDLEGYAIARTSSGSIKLGRITGRIEATDSGGNIAVEQAGSDLVARTSSGSISVQKVRGKIEASNSGGNIRVEEAASNVAAKTSSGTINFGSVGGAVEVLNSGGNIRIDSAGGNVTAQTSSGSIQIGTVKGKTLNAKNSGGDIELGTAEGSVKAETSSGNVRIKSAGGNLDLRNSGGSIEIGETSGSVTAETSSGNIRIKSAKGNIDARNSGGSIAVEEAGGDSSLRTSSGSIVVALAQGKVEAKNSGGKIEVSDARDIVQAETSSGGIAVNFSTAPKADCRLQVSGGGVTVGLPRSAGFNLDAASSGGKIVTETPVTVVVQGEQKQGVLQGKINGGGPALMLRSSSGDIRLRESALTVAAEEKSRSR